MKSILALVLLPLAVAVASAQAPPPPATEYATFPGAFDSTNDRFAGNHAFDGFIGFLSNPILNVDPRSMTALWPIYGYAHTSGVPALPSADINEIGAGLTVALSDKLAVGFNDGGYAIVNVQPGNGPFRDRFGRLRDRGDFSGQRQGWMNLGGFVQYTFLENPEAQFLMTGGLRWIAPSGAHDVFQGNGPVRLAPYLTAGKAWGDVHFLATAGYQFPTGTNATSLEFFYANFHLDRRFGWLYPLVELNCIYHSTSVDLDAPSRFGFVDFGSFSSSGNLVMLAVGANAAVVPNKVEVGAVYVTTLASQRDFNADGLLVKLLFRY